MYITAPKTRKYNMENPIDPDHKQQPQVLKVERRCYEQEQLNDELEYVGPKNGQLEFPQRLDRMR